MSYRICLLCDRFDIGGVETHVLTLAEALAKKGHRVTVVSSGGVYAKGASKYFSHVCLPFTQKRRILFCLFSLRRLFKEKHFDVIHAHTRYTAFLCRLLSRRFVTTAHWVFNTRFPYRTLSAWGEHSLAVSQDIGRYLEKEYGIGRERLTVTVNGIDTDRFFSSKSEDGIYRICLCSRLDSDRSAAAFLLCRALSNLGQGVPFSAVIIGDGEDKDALKDVARAANKRLGAPCISLAGARDDVESFLASADIFVGVSRAALEAMAAECAVILAGNEGYLSIFNPAHSARAEQTNFCCRDAEAATVKALSRDLSHLLSLPKEKLREMGTANRAYIKERYSAEKMARDALSVYEGVKKRRAVLCGYYGFGNVGDALMHRALSARLKTEGYKDIRTISSARLSLSSLYALWQGYDFFLGGGNLLQDETSLRSLWFYAALTRFAKRRGCSLHLLSAGFGGFSPKGMQQTRRLLPLFDTVECRTTADLLFAKACNAKGSYHSYDAVLDLAIEKKKESADKMMLALRAPKDSAEATAMLAFCFRLCRLYGKNRLFILSMHPKDEKALRALSKKTAIPFFAGDANVFLKLLKACEGVYAMRLHASVCALSAGIVSFLYDGSEKNRFFAKDIEGYAKEASLPSPVRLFSFFDTEIVLPKLSVSAVSSICERARTARKQHST